LRRISHTLFRQILLLVLLDGSFPGWIFCVLL